MTTNEPPPLDEPGLAGRGAVPHDRAAQKEAGEVAERSAGTREAEIREAQRSDPEEPDPA
jgi:hypothetical protein